MSAGHCHNADMNNEERHEVALWRHSILGPLVSARLERGDRCAEFQAAAKRRYVRPDGSSVKLSARTIEGWYYRYLAGGLEGLRPSRRSDRGHGKHLDETVRDLIVRLKREKPRRSVRRLIKILERANKVMPGTLTRSTVHRLLVEHRLGGRPERKALRERRSFLVEHAGDLWVGDVMHGPRVLVDPSGLARKSYLVSVMDVATRFLVASQFTRSEQAVDHERVLKAALRTYGRPRTYYVDLGAAYIADSLKNGCAALGIHLLHTAPRDAQAKGSIERWHRTWRAEVGDELPDEALPLSELNAKHWAWLRTEYHAREHSTTKRRPLEHLLAESGHVRELPHRVDIDEAFWHRVRRKVRNDGTVRFEGGYLEVSYELTGSWVELRFDPTIDNPRPKVYVDDHFICDTTPLDLHSNATRRRRRKSIVDDPAQATGIDVLGDIEEEHYERTSLVRSDDQEDG